MKEVTIKMTEDELKEANKILGSFGKKITPEEEKKKIEEKSKMKTKYKVKPYSQEDTIHIIPEMLEAANLNSKLKLYIYGNDNDHVLYITDLHIEDIDWGDKVVEEWCNGVVFNSFDEIEIEAKNFWPDLCNVYGGNKMTAEYSDHIITVTLEVDEDEFEQWSKESEIKPQKFTITTDAEGRATISKKILQAADLLNTTVSWNIFKNDSGSKLYISYSSHPYMDFDGEVCTNIKSIECGDKTTLRIKIGGESYTNYNVYTDQDLITIDVNSGVMVDDDDLTMDQIDRRIINMQKEEKESEETEKKIKDYAKQKAEQQKEEVEIETLKKRVEQLIYEIFNDVEKIKNKTGIDLTDTVVTVIKTMYDHSEKVKI